MVSANRPTERLTEKPTIGSLRPRRADGLPPGQRLIEHFPRFSDKPLRWAPVPGSASLDICVEGELVATIGDADWARHEYVDQVSDFHCVTTWSVRGLRWGGYRLVDVIASALDSSIESLPPFLEATAADRVSAICRTEDLDRTDTLLATDLDGRPLDRRHGAPLRLVSPHQYGYKSAKHLVAIDFRHDQPASTIGAKEHLRARVDLEERHSTLPNWLVRVPYRLSIVPTALAAERGLRNSRGH